jgi:hypothetical protein
MSPSQSRHIIPLKGEQVQCLSVKHEFSAQKYYLTLRISVVDPDPNQQGIGSVIN